MGKSIPNHIPKTVWVTEDLRRAVALAESHDPLLQSKDFNKKIEILINEATSRRLLDASNKIVTTVKNDFGNILTLRLVITEQWVLVGGLLADGTQYAAVYAHPSVFPPDALEAFVSAVQLTNPN